MQKLITRRCCPHLPFFTTVRFGRISRATTLKKAGAGGVSVFLGRAASPRLSLIWLSRLSGGSCLGRCPGRPCPGGAAGGTGRSPAASGVFSLSSDLGKQLYRSSQATGIFNSEANGISIVQVCTYPAFPRQNVKAKPMFPFKTWVWPSGLFFKAG